MNALGNSKSHCSSSGTDRSRAVCKEPVRAPKKTSRPISKENKTSKPVAKKWSQKSSGRYDPYQQKQKPCPELNYTPTSYVYDYEDPSWRPASPTWPDKDNS